MKECTTLAQIQQAKDRANKAIEMAVETFQKETGFTVTGLNWEFATHPIMGGQTFRFFTFHTIEVKL